MKQQLNLINAHERTLGQIFSDDYAFEIPPYQRPYAWEVEQTRELLSDLLDAMDDPDSTGGVYFLGSIVLIKSPNDPLSKVVDGQQRLTTLTILLSILRDLTADLERKIDRGRYILQKANPDLGTKQRCRLLLRLQDRPFFEKRIQLSDSTRELPDPSTLEGSQRNIAENARFLRAELVALDEYRRNQLMAFVIQSCYLVVVAVPTADSARRIFTVLNARGLDLAATDILKANLLERAGNEAEAELATRWEVMESDLGREKFVELFGHIRMIYERAKPRSALETGFPKFVAPFNGNPASFVSEVLEPIAEQIVLLSDTNAVESRFGSAAAKAVRSLERIDNKDWMPPALLRLWKSGDASVVADFLINLERLAYYMFVCRMGINERIARFADVMDELDPRDAKAIRIDGIELDTAEQAAFLQALDGPIYLKSRICRPILQRLDEALSTGGARYDNLVSIEHVLPQSVTADSEWAKLFPDPRVREQWTHRLANLVLLTTRSNIRASNWSFERKKKEYFASKDGTAPFPLTQSVLQTKDWSVDDLDGRQKRFLSRLGNVWHLTPS